MMPLANKTALVTGASQGLGRAIALRLAREGAAVGINYLSNSAGAESLAAEIAAGQGRSVLVRADVGDGSQVRAMVDQVSSEFGPVDILINNAGLHRPGDLFDFEYSQMAPMRRTNVDGMFHVTRAVVDCMKTRGFGRIVNIASIAAYGTRVKGTTFYAATKAAVIALTRRFAMELGPFGITVNAIAPGFIATKMSIGSRTPEQLRAFEEDLAKVTMMRRSGGPEDIAHAAAFLVSPESSFITAQVLTVDGGRMDYIGRL